MKKPLVVLCILLVCWAFFIRPHVHFSSPKVPLLQSNSATEEQFQHVFSKSFGYTLIGKKPVSIEYWGRSDCFLEPKYKEGFYSLLKTLFGNSDRFVLKIFHRSDFYSEIILIHVPSLMSSIKKNRYLSSFITREFGTLKKFRSSLFDPQKHIVDCFRWDVVALGIVLGYGEENSRFYRRYIDVGLYLKKYPLVCLLPFNPKPMPDAITIEHPQYLVKDLLYRPIAPAIKAKAFASLEEEWTWMRKIKNKDINATEVPYLFQLPFFISKKCATTDKIFQQYNKARNVLAELFQERKFIKVVTEEVNKTLPQEKGNVKASESVKRTHLDENQRREKLRV